MSKAPDPIQTTPCLVAARYDRGECGWPTCGCPNLEQPKTQTAASGPVASHRFDNAKRRRPDGHARQAMLTPAYVLEPVRGLLNGIDLDPCTEPDNPTGAKTFFHLPQDGCVLPWKASRIFVNPPYGEAKDRWAKRCISEGSAGKFIVLLVPSHTETKMFQELLNAAWTVMFVRARLRFGVLRENRRQEAASHGSALFGFNVDLRCLDRSLGTAFARQVS